MAEMDKALEKASDIDAKVKGWLKEAYDAA